jgi:cytochrome c biogenesis protein
LDPDLGLDLLFLASAPQGPNGPEPTGAPWLEEPALLLDVYRGDLRFDRVQNVNALDTTAMELVAQTYLREDQALELDGGIRVAFPEIRRWVAFQISDRPTAPVLLAAGALILLGLLPALYAYRRRLWLAATSDLEHGRTVLSVAGRSFQRPEAFAAEFTDIVETLRQQLGKPAAGGEGEPRPERETEVVPR